jgi:hypothetical protein
VLEIEETWSPLPLWISCAPGIVRNSLPPVQKCHVCSTDACRNRRISQPEEDRQIGVYLCFPLNTDFEIARKRFVEAIERFRSIARFRLRAGGAFCVDEYAVVWAGEDGV